MRTDRPLSEHEGALFDAVCILARTVLELGADPKILNDRLTEAMRNTEALGNSNGAATLGFLIRALFAPSDPAPEHDTKPSLRIV
jgi:hypothetical protein